MVGAARVSRLATCPQAESTTRKNEIATTMLRMIEAPKKKIQLK
jgi:hypothetical protein